MLDAYRQYAAERENLGIPPLPLDAAQTADLCELFKSPPAGEEEFLMELLTERVSPGVDPAAKVKAAFLTQIAKNEAQSPLLSRTKAVEMLGTMLGGYNIEALIEFLSVEELADTAVEALSNTLLIFDRFDEIFNLSKSNSNAKKVVESWANA